MPYRNAGSETVLHELMKAAAQAGHQVQVWCTHEDAETPWRGNLKPEQFDGYTVHRVRNVIVAGKQVQAFRPDVVVSHHQHASHAIQVARSIRARSVFTVHNDMVLNRRPLRARPDLVIYNSTWVRESLTRQFGTPRDSMVFHPPLTPDRHRVPSTGDAITLVNLNRDKGADLFYALAQAEPDRKFLGVVGGHGREQVRKRLPNVEILEHGPDMKRVWSRTRIVLMPSVYESYGLVAVEAGVNAIPTIAHPTPGLVENLGPDGLFADRDSIAEWRHHLDVLDGQLEYDEASAYAKSRADAAVAATRESLNHWVDWISM